MKILLLGKNGQLGWELQRSLAVLGEVVALDRSSASHAADLAQPEALRATVREVAPDVIVNAAAYTAVDKAETDVEAARLVNATAPQVLAQEAQRLGAWLVHYSTDYVFDGTGDTPWREGDATGPLSVYGQTKLEGEQHIAQACERHLILRTSWVFAAHGQNFLKTMLRLGTERETLTIVSDQVGTPTGAELLADVSAHAIARVRQEPGLAGLYHVSASGYTNWCEYAGWVLQEAKAANPDLRTATLAPIPTSGYPTPARRPLNSRLDTSRFQKAFGLRLPPWQQGVSRVVQELVKRS